MNNIKLFESRHICSVWDENAQKWYFAIVDVVSVLTASVDAGVYWRKLKERLIKEGNETVTNCHSLKMIAADGKQRRTDVADAEELLRLIQSIPSPKAEPFKLWLAKVGYERLEEIENPELSMERMQALYEKKGYPKEWIYALLLNSGKETPSKTGGVLSEDASKLLIEAELDVLPDMFRRYQRIAQEWLGLEVLRETFNSLLLD